MRDDHFIWGFFLIAVIACVMGIFESIEVGRLKQENEFLKEENQMLENTLDNLGAEIEELSTTVDNLMREINRGNEWNEEAIPEYRR